VSIFKIFELPKFVVLSPRITLSFTATSKESLFIIMAHTGGRIIIASISLYFRKQTIPLKRYLEISGCDINSHRYTLSITKLLRLFCQKRTHFFSPYGETNFSFFFFPWCYDVIKYAWTCFGILPFCLFFFLVK